MGARGLTQRLFALINKRIIHLNCQPSRFERTSKVADIDPNVYIYSVYFKKLPETI